MHAQTSLQTGRPEIDRLCPMIRAFLEKDVLDVIVDGRKIRGYRSPDARSVWIRDHSDMMRGFRYFEPDVRSAVEHFAETQAENGRIFDYFTTFPEKLPCERENWTKYVRVPVEADVEYRFVKAAFLAWQACGDDGWIRRMLPKMEKALGYAFSHPWRWDAERGLVKRAYTIDTWDFAYTAGKHDWLQFQIDDHTYWGIMHGDNSGYYEACRLVESLHRRLENPEAAAPWARRAEALKENLTRLCWNGRFFTHFVKITDVHIPGAREEEQLSLSNPMDINRGAATEEQAASILAEYRERGRRGGAFAEWYSIDPPFPDGVFGDERLEAGAYVNGGILPLVGGELARAALEHGFERYGVEILSAYSRLIAAKGESYLWYFPDGTPSTREASTSPEALPTDGWGSSAMLYALVEGLAGVTDLGKGFDSARIAPRWPAADVRSAHVDLAYPASGARIGYDWRLGENRITLEVKAPPGAALALHVLLPDGATCRGVTLDGAARNFCPCRAGDSRYVDFEAVSPGGKRIEILC